MRRTAPLRWLVLALVLAPLLAAVVLARPVAAEELYFPETGLTLSDEHGFLSY